MCARDEAHWQVSRPQMSTVLTTSRKRHGGLGFAQNIKASYALAARLPLAIELPCPLDGDFAPHTRIWFATLTA